MKIKCVLLLLAAIVLLPACTPGPSPTEVMPAPGGSYTNVLPSALADMLKNKDFVLINVHIPFAGNIRGTDLSIPYDQIGQNLSLLPADRNAMIVLYCRSGHMSTIAAEQLVSLGYTNVWNLKGGMVAWENTGHAIER